jgi:hypothetical protein
MTHYDNSIGEVMLFHVYYNRVQHTCYSVISIAVQLTNSCSRVLFGTVAYKDATVGGKWTRVLCLNTRGTKAGSV